MIEGLKVIIKGSELREVINTKIGWNADKLLKVSQRKIQIAGGGDTEAEEKQLQRDTRQLQFLHDHIKDDEEYSLTMPEVSSIGVGLETENEKSKIVKLN